MRRVLFEGDFSCFVALPIRPFRPRYAYELKRF